MQKHRPNMIERLRARKERHRARGLPYRIGFAIAGFTVVLAGVVLLVLPGPGLLLIAVGLAMLALEFGWAERALESALARLESGLDRARRRRRPDDG